MHYYKSKIIQTGFEEAIDKVTGLLKEEGFGILTEIDVKQTLKKKLDVDFKPYKILGACNPHFAYQAFQTEDKIGALLPCNVIVIDQGQGRTEVAIMDAGSMMQQIGNDKLGEIAGEVSKRMEGVLDKL